MNFEEKFVRNIQTTKGKILSYRTDEVICPNGRLAKRDVIDHNGGVCVAPITDDDEIILIRQFRYSYKEVLLEVPAGKLEKGENADTESAGRRELKEETGAEAERIYDFGVFYPTCGYCNEKIYLYAATGLSYGEQELDPDEVIETVKIKISDAVKMVMNGEIVDGKSIALIMKINEAKREGLL